MNFVYSYLILEFEKNSKIFKSIKSYEVEWENENNFKVSLNIQIWGKIMKIPKRSNLPLK